MTGPKFKLRPILIHEEDHDILAMKNVDVHLWPHDDRISIESSNGGCHDSVFVEEIPAFIKALKGWLRDYKARIKMEKSQ